jgi:hypothetical protein
MTKIHSDASSQVCQALFLHMPIVVQIILMTIYSLACMHAVLDGSTDELWPAV